MLFFKTKGITTFTKFKFELRLPNNWPIGQEALTWGGFYVNGREMPPSGSLLTFADPCPDLKFISTADQIQDNSKAPTPWNQVELSDAQTWEDICYGNGLYFGVASSGNNKVMTSPDGEYWERYNFESTWKACAYGNGIYVALADGGTKRLLYSTDAKNWTYSTIEDGSWQALTYGGDRSWLLGSNQIFV